MFCALCGTENPDGALKCRSCQAPVLAVGSPVSPPAPTPRAVPVPRPLEASPADVFRTSAAPAAAPPPPATHLQPPPLPALQRTGTAPARPSILVPKNPAAVPPLPTTPVVIQPRIAGAAPAPLPAPAATNPALQAARPPVTPAPHRTEPDRPAARPLPVAPLSAVPLPPPPVTFAPPRAPSVPPPTPAPAPLPELAPLPPPELPPPPVVTAAPAAVAPPAADPAFPELPPIPEMDSPPVPAEPPPPPVPPPAAAEAAPVEPVASPAVPLSPLVGDGPQPPVARAASWSQKIAAALVDGAVVFGLTLGYAAVELLELPPDDPTSTQALEGVDRFIDLLARYSAFILGMLIACSVAVFLYEGLAVALMGRTVGQKVMDLRLLRLRDGQRAGGRLALLRGLLAGVGLLVLGAGWLWAPFDRRRAALHDRWTGLVLVEDPQAPVPPPSTAATQPPLPPASEPLRPEASAPPDPPAAAP
ncbi:MAG: RDD family protein [Deltaproteobacteria bacterium]|nr:RDD family protein [Deltaproteobacteria bacterium]